MLTTMDLRLFGPEYELSNPLTVSRFFGQNEVQRLIGEETLNLMEILFNAMGYPRDAFPMRRKSTAGE
jgi:hypothetical protein